MNGLIRALPNMGVLICNLLKSPHMEDEVAWAIWVILKYCQPAGIEQSIDAHALLAAHPGEFLAEPIFWILPSISIAISLACLVAGYRKLFPLWGGHFSSKAIELLAVYPLIVYFAFKPLRDILDNLIRINW